MVFQETVLVVECHKIPLTKLEGSASLKKICVLKLKTLDPFFVDKDSRQEAEGQEVR